MSRENSSLTPNASFVVIKYGDNQKTLLNPWCSTKVFMEWLRRICNADSNSTLDLVDLDGHIKNLPMTSEDYASDYVTSRETYVVIRVERQDEQGPMKYISLLNNLDVINKDLLTKLNNLSLPERGIKRDRSRKTPSRTSRVSSTRNENRPRSQIKHLSNTLSFSKQTTPKSKQEGGDARGSLSQKQMEDESEEVSTLRRQATRELSSDEAGGIMLRKSSRTHAIESVRQATKHLTGKSASSVSKTKFQASLTKAVSRASRQSVSRNVATRSSTILSRTSRTSSTASIQSQVNDKKASSSGVTGRASLQRYLSAQRKSISDPTKMILEKIPSKSKDGVRKTQKNTGEKQLWFPHGAILAVRKSEGTYPKEEFFLCRNLRNIYNYTKQAPVNWLVKKARHKLKPQALQSGYVIGFRDTIDTLSILMQVDPIRVSRLYYVLPEDQAAEVRKLVTLSENLEEGTISLEDLDEDVEPAVLIDEPPAKKPRLKKTASQKLRDKALRAAGKEKESVKGTKQRQKAKSGGDKEPRKRKSRKINELELHPRPEITVLEKDPLYETREPMPYISKVANAQLIYRAIYLKDNKLLTKLLKDSRLIYYLYTKSVENSDSPLKEAIRVGDLDIFNTVYDEFNTNKFRERLQNNRNETTMLDRLGTGNYNELSLGIQFIRKITASRGSREGNNAFLKKETKAYCRSIEVALSTPGALQFWNQQTERSIHFSLPKSLCDLLLLGENKTAGSLVEEHLVRYRRPFNTLFKELLLFTTEDLTSCSPSAVRVIARRFNKLSPFHCAAVNPNGKYLEKLLTVQPDIQITDKAGRTPLHYAAGCSSVQPLEILFRWGANLGQADQERRIPLHYAVLANRLENVRLLLEEGKKKNVNNPLEQKRDVGSINHRTKNSSTPLMLAVEHQFYEVVEILLVYGADVNAKQSVSENKKTALMIAAAQGNLKLVQLLVKHGAVVEQQDRMGCTAVIYACRNGATSVLSYLLHIGANGERADNSGNTPIHYAAAYGWYFTLKLLLEAGVDPNVPNMWKTTPIAVAYFKGHMGIVQELLHHGKVDINFPDEDGLTMIFHACSGDLYQEDLCEQIQYMVEEKEALCSGKDNTGKTLLHYVASLSVECDASETDDAEITRKRTAACLQSVAMAKIFLEKGCDLNAVDNKGFTAAMLAVGKVENFALAEFLIQQGGVILLPPDGDPSTSVLHEMVENQWKYAQNLSKLLDLMMKDNKYTDILKKMARYVDKNGYTPLLYTLVKARDGQYYLHQTRADSDLNKQLFKSSWEGVREFVKRLVKDLDADLQAKVEKIFFPVGSEPGPGTNQWWNDFTIAGRSAVHLALVNYDPAFNDLEEAYPYSGQIFRDLVRLGADVNVCCLNGLTPLGLCITHTLSTCTERNNYELFDFLLKEGKCDFNLPFKQSVDGQMLNPLLVACQRGTDANLINKLIDCGCDVEAIVPGSRMNCVHCLVTLANATSKEVLIKVLDKLAEKKFNFDATDSSGKTALHYAVKNNPGLMDQSYELEVKLLRLKANADLADREGKIALHYVFINDHSYGIRYFHYQRPSADPAELAKLIGKVTSKDQVNFKDTSGRTALHYAAKNGATVSCMYLLMIGADIDIQDNDGNTALSLAVQENHDSCATTLIQSGATLMCTITPQDSNLSNGSTEEKAASEELKEEWCCKLVALFKEDEPIKSIPLYQAAIENNLTGVAMFVAEADSRKSGLNALDAITIAMKTCKYNIAWHLLCTTTNLASLLQLGKNKQNLLHALTLSCENNTNESSDIIAKIAEFLLKIGVSAKAGDSWNCTPIQYAVLYRQFKLARYLAEESGGFDATYEDDFNRSYIAAALWKYHTIETDQDTWDFIQEMICQKVSPNRLFGMPLYPDLMQCSVNGKKRDSDFWQSYPANQTTPLIAAISCANFILSHNFLVYHADPNMPDGNKITPLMHAVILNKANHLKQLLNYTYEISKPKESVIEQKKKQSKAFQFQLKTPKNYSDDEDEDAANDEDTTNADDVGTGDKDAADVNGISENIEEVEIVEKTSSVMVNAKDSEGRTALHYVAKPHPHGTFDNSEMAFVLVHAGAKLLVDLSGLNPYQLALKIGAKNVAAVLKKHFGLKDAPEEISKGKTFLVDDGLHGKLDKWPDFRDSAEKALRRYDSSMEVDYTYIHKVDRSCNVTNGQLVRDEKEDLYYDVLLTKVDVKQGAFGMYNFYELQMVYDQNKSLYILFTRWGRIGDRGQFQHTPFFDKDEAIKEFSKIFKEKTGNNWTDVKNFEQKPKKYRLVEDVARRAPTSQKDVEFTLDSACKSLLPQHLYRIIKAMMDPKEIQLLMNKAPGVNTKALPFGQLNRERLLQGKELLEQLELLVDKIEKLQHNLDDPEKLQNYEESIEQIAELSNQYFHVMPQNDYVFEKIQPLDKRKALATQMYSVLNFLDYEIASKMLLAAMHYRKEYNPVDYVYRCLDCKIERLQRDDFMAELILKYIWIGSKDNESRVQGIYKLCRKGEAERLEANEQGKRCLFWHGSDTCNLLSILNQGLLVCPRDIHRYWSHGKGIYFSDKFSLSSAYTGSSKVRFLLLCEVALGKSWVYDYNGLDRDKAMADCDTLIIPEGSKTDSSDWLILESGVSIPQTPPCDSKYMVKDPARVCLRYLVQL